MPERYITPLVGLTSAWQGKLTIAGLLTFFSEIAGRLFYMEMDMVVLVVLLVLLDLITGILKAFREKRFSSIGLRQTAIKVIEYALLLSVASMVSNTFVSSGIPVISYAMGSIGTLAFAYVAVVESVSIFENVFGSSSRARKVWQAIKGQLSRDGIPDELL